MGRLSKEEVARFGGAGWALRMCEKEGIEACKKELERRGILDIPLNISNAQLHEFENRVRMNVLNTVMLLSVSVMMDEFEFDRDMLVRYIERFNERSDCLDGDYVRWEEIQQTLQDEINLKLPLTEEILNLHKELHDA